MSTPIEVVTNIATEIFPKDNIFIILTVDSETGKCSFSSNLNRSMMILALKDFVKSLEEREAANN